MVFILDSLSGRLDLVAGRGVIGRARSTGVISIGVNRAVVVRSPGIDSTACPCCGGDHVASLCPRRGVGASHRRGSRSAIILPVDPGGAVSVCRCALGVTSTRRAAVISGTAKSGTCAISRRTTGTPGACGIGRCSSSRGRCSTRASRSSGRTGCSPARTSAACPPATRAGGKNRLKSHRTGEGQRRDYG